MATGLKVADLNRRYREGGPSAASSPGVFFHTFDSDMPVFLQPVALTDRMSFSLANAQGPCPFHVWGWRPGIIASAAAVEECTLCSWAEDGHTDRRTCTNETHYCVPGCLNTSDYFGTLAPLAGQAPEPQATRFEQWPKGPYAPHDWAKMLQRHTAEIRRGKRCHNEVVLATECCMRRLPTAVEAFWLPRLATQEDIELMRAQHRSFPRAFGIGSKLARRPLVVFDDQNQTAPFAHHHGRVGTSSLEDELDGPDFRLRRERYTTPSRRPSALLLTSKTRP